MEQTGQVVQTIKKFFFSTVSGGTMRLQQEYSEGNGYQASMK